MSRVKERIELMRRTGAAVPPESAATPPAAAPVGGGSARARRYGGADRDFAASETTPEASAAGGVSSPGASHVQSPALPAPPVPTRPEAPARTSTPAAVSRRDRFGPSREAAAPNGVQAGGRALPVGPALAPAPNPGEESEHHRQTLKHCLAMWNLTPGRDCDRELILHSAAWYERNQPWALAGVHSMVARALDAIREQRRGEDSTARATPTQRADGDEAAADEETRGSRPTRYGRQRG